MRAVWLGTVCVRVVSWEFMVGELLVSADRHRDSASSSEPMEPVAVAPALV